MMMTMSVMKSMTMRMMLIFFACSLHCMLLKKLCFCCVPCLFILFGFVYCLRLLVCRSLMFVYRLFVFVYRLFVFVYRLFMFVYCLLILFITCSCSFIFAPLSLFTFLFVWYIGCLLCLFIACCICLLSGWYTTSSCLLFAPFVYCLLHLVYCLVLFVYRLFLYCYYLFLFVSWPFVYCLSSLFAHAPVFFLLALFDYCLSS